MTEFNTLGALAMASIGSFAAAQQAARPTTLQAAPQPATTPRRDRTTDASAPERHNANR